MSLWPQAATDARQTGLQQVLQFDTGLAVVQAANKMRTDALNLNAMLSGATPASPPCFPAPAWAINCRKWPKLSSSARRPG